MNELGAAIASVKEPQQRRRRTSRQSSRRSGRPSDRLGSSPLLSLLDQILLGVVLVYVSHAWIYLADFQTQLQIDAPFIFPFQVFAQLIGFYALFRLGIGRVLLQIRRQPIFLFLVAWGGLSMLWSTSPYNTFGMFRTMVLLWASCMYFPLALSEWEIYRSVRLTLFVILFGSVLAALFTPFGVAGGVHEGSWRGLFGHKNGLGEVSALGVLVSASAIFTARRVVVMDWLLFACASLCVLSSHSANGFGTALVALVVTGVAVIAGNLSRYSAINRLVFLWAAIAVGIFSGFALSAFLEVSGRDLTFTGRVDIWKNYLALAAYHPLLGWGWTTSSSDENVLTIIRKNTGLDFVRSAHSAYVMMIFELGYIGFIAFASWSLTSITRAAYYVCGRPNRQATLMLSVSLGMAIFGGFEVVAGFLTNAWLFLLLIYSSLVIQAARDSRLLTYQPARSAGARQ